MHNIHTKVMEKISKGLVQQKPHWKFRLEKVASWGIFALIGIVCVYVMSFVLLISDEMEFFEMLGFGPRGVYMFIHALPVLLLVGIVMLLIAMVLLVRFYSHAYRFSTLAVLGAVFFVGGIVTLGVRQFDSSLHLARFGEHGELPFVRSLHDRYRPPHARPVAQGRVLSVDTDGFTISDRHDNETLVILTNSDTQYTFSEAVLVGDILKVLGIREGGMITATVVTKRNQR